MKVICIDNKKYIEYVTLPVYCAERIPILVVGKEYECIKEKEYEYLILIDDTYISWYSKSRFITKEEYRNQRLEDIGI